MPKQKIATAVFTEFPNLDAAFEEIYTTLQHYQAMCDALEQIRDVTTQDEVKEIVNNAL